MPPASASIGNVRMPPGRLSVTWAKKSSKASPRKKLKPRSKATLVGDGAVSMEERLASVAANGRRGTDGHETIMARPAFANRVRARKSTRSGGASHGKKKPEMMV